MVKRLNKPRKWQDKKEITLVDHHILLTTNGIGQMYDWEQIEKVYETKENIILYLTGKQLNFIIVKKPRNKDVTPNIKNFFLTLKKGLKNKNMENSSELLFKIIRCCFDYLLFIIVFI